MQKVGIDISPENTLEVQDQSGDRVTAASLVSPKRKRPYKTKSDVWYHFKKVKKEGGGLADKATCNYCLKSFSCPSSEGTRTLRRHLEKCLSTPIATKTQSKR